MSTDDSKGCISTWAPYAPGYYLQRQSPSTSNSNTTSLSPYYSYTGSHAMTRSHSQASSGSNSSSYGQYSGSSGYQYSTSTASSALDVQEYPISPYPIETSYASSAGAPKRNQSRTKQTTALPNNSPQLQFPCRYSGCQHISSRSFDLERHMKRHYPVPAEDKFDCPGKGCGRVGFHGFDRKDRMTEHLRNYHTWDIPKNKTKTTTGSRRRLLPFDTRDSLTSDENSRTRMPKRVSSENLETILESTKVDRGRRKGRPSPPDLQQPWDNQASHLSLSKLDAVSIRKQSAASKMIDSQVDNDPDTEKSTQQVTISKAVEAMLPSPSDQRQVSLQQAVTGTLPKLGNIADSRVTTALHRAGYQGHEAITKQIPESRLNPIITHHEGTSPDESVRRDNEGITPLLLEKGADSSIAISEGTAPHDALNSPVDLLAQVGLLDVPNRKAALSRCPTQKKSLCNKGTVERARQVDRYIKEISLFNDLVCVHGANVKSDVVHVHALSTAPRLQLSTFGMSTADQIHRLRHLAMTMPSTLEYDVLRGRLLTTWSLPKSLDSPASKIHMERLVPGMEGAGYRGHALQLNQAQRDNSLRRYNTNRRTECTAEASEIIRKSDYIHVGFGAPPMSNSEDVGRNEILPGPDDIQIHRDLSGCTLIGAPSAPSVQSQPISDESQLLPSYQAFVIKIRNLRIEARIWSGIDGFRLVTYISFQGEPPPVKGKKRVHWKCQCGQRLYDDFHELRPGAVRDLERQLNKNSEPGQNSNQGRSAHQQGLLQSMASTLNGAMSSSWNRSQGKNQTPSLPTNRFDTSIQDPTDLTASPTESLFLLLCIPHQKHATKLIQMNVCHLQSDRLFFAKLKPEYHRMRGRWISIFSLKKLIKIRFVKFELHRKELVDILKTNEVIPPENKKNEYRYNPTPPETIPPVGENHMMHLYDHPEDADDAAVCLDRIPKKLRERLKVCPQRRTGLGWGVHFVEGFHWVKFCIMGLIGLISCVGFGICWSRFKDDVQGGFGVTACMMVGLTFTTGVVQAVLDPK